MTTITYNTQRSGCYLGESAALNIINEEIIVASGSGVLKPGTVLGAVPSGAFTVTPGVAVSGSGGTPGNGSIGSVTADAAAPTGTYQVVILNPATNAGAFEVRKPDGSVDGNGTVGVAYNGTINFTLADGATDFSEDDRIPVVVTEARGVKYVPHDPSLANGGQNATAILFHPVDATGGDIKTVATVRGPATIFNPYLVFKSGISADNLAAAMTALRHKGLAILPQHAS